MKSHLLHTAKLVTVKVPVLLTLVLVVSACGIETTPEYKDNTLRDGSDFYGASDRTSLTDMIGLTGDGAKDDGGSGNGIGVNVFLWRAALDTFSFIPLSSADPFGGLIITDWYNPPGSPNERLKVTVYILDKRLRADGVRVSVFRQVRGPDGVNWVNATVDENTGSKLEDSVLTRARELRIEAAANQ